MPKAHLRVGMVLLIPLAGVGIALQTSATPSGVWRSPLRGILTLLENGGRVDWGPGDILAFDRTDADGRFDLYTMRIDGSGMRCLTCGRAELPPGHKGNPAWHPSGKYIVFQAAQPWQTRESGVASSPEQSDHVRKMEYATRPGAGFANDLWVTDPSGSHFWKLTDEPKRHGVLHAHFSPRGDLLSWSERIAPGVTDIGEWQLKVAKFKIVDGVPTISDVRSFQPESRGFYESHGFDAAATRLIFTATRRQGSEWAFDIFTSTLAGGDLRNLTNSADAWDEHAHYSPSGETIMWESSMGYPLPQSWEGANGLRSEYWLMKADGSAPRQLTRFNVRGAPEYEPEGCAPSDYSWSPDGTRAAAFLQINSAEAKGKIVLLDFTRAM